jgi:predicted RND superfamily exporter protein/phosphatidylglycerophosphatase A
VPRHEPPPRGVIAYVEGWLAGAAVWSLAHRWLVLAVAAALTVAAGWRARSLRIDTDLTHLLPRSFESVQNLERLEDQSAGVGYVSIVLQGGAPEQRRAFADEVAQDLTALPSIAYVDYKRPFEFFEDRALYYADLEDLERVRDQVEERRLWEARKRSALHDLGLDELGEPPSVAFDDLRAKYEARAKRYGVELGASRPAPTPYWEDDDEGLLVLLARPSKRASDVTFSQTVVGDVEGVLARHDADREAAKLEVALSGRFKKKVDQKSQIESDLALASTLALASMLSYLGLHFRSVRAVGLVIAPLLIALVWTFGLVAASFGSLNLLSGFIGCLLVGVGADQGIHLLARVDAERAAGADVVSAVRRAYGSTGRAALAATLTTAIGFVGVAVSEFRAFRELGIIATGGLILIILSYATVLPALIGSFGAARAPRAAPPSSFARVLPRWAPVTGWAAVLLGVAALTRAPDVKFDYDFASLEDSNIASFELDKRINHILGHSQTPLVVIADSAEQERQIVQTLRERVEDRASSTVQMVLSLDDFAPRDAEAKRAVIERIGEQLRLIKPKWLDEDQSRQRDRALELTAATPFGRADLPDEVQRQFTSLRGEHSYVLVYPRVSMSDGVGVRALASELRAITLPDGSRLQIAGEAMILADVLAMVTSEAPPIIALTIGLVLLALWVLLGRSLVLPSAAAAVGTLGVTAGLMPMCGLELNYLNIVIVPVLFGMSVDRAIHLVLRHGLERDTVSIVSETGRAIAGALATTALGFGAFTLAHHPGLASLGQLAVLGLFVNVLVCLVAVPSLLVLVDRSRAIRATEGRAGLWTHLAVTLGLAGDAPIAPGTLGALIAVPIGFAAQRLGGGGRAALVAVLTVASVVVVGRYLRHLRRKDGDPQEVVVDELVGCLIAMLMVPQGLVWALAAFAMFRVFDIFKPWPVGYIDRRVHGALGVVGDDVAAGLLAGASLVAVHYAGITQGWWT